MSKTQFDKLDRVMVEKEGLSLRHCASGVRTAMLLVLSRAKKNCGTAARAFVEAGNIGFDLQSSLEFARFVVETPVK